MVKVYKRVDAESYESKDYASILRSIIGDKYVGMVDRGGVLAEVRTNADLTQAELSKIKEIARVDFTVTT